MALGWGHALALCAEGEVFSWGYAADGRLGWGPTQAPPMEEAAARPAGAAGGDLAEAAAFVARAMEGEKDAALAFEPGRVTAVLPPGVRAAAVACGMDHSLVLSEDGRIFSFGDNSLGQLGRPPQNPGPSPDPPGPVPGIPCATAVAAGVGHSLAVVGSSRVLTWGWSPGGPRGERAHAPRPLPPGFAGAAGIVKVGAARAHSVALDAGGRLWTWGSGKDGRLGLGRSRDEAEPRQVEALEGLRVVDFACGYDHTVVLAEELGGAS